MASGIGPTLVVLLLLVAACLTDAVDSGSACGPVDILFIVDGSGSVGYANFRTTLEFVKNVTGELEIGPFDVQIGMLAFDTYVQEEFNFNTFSTKQDVLDRVSTTRYGEGLTHTGDALEYARVNSFTKENGKRPNAAQVAIVMTDGKSQDWSRTAKEAKRLRDKGVTIFSVGIGEGTNLTELNAIASDPDKTHVYSVDDFYSLVMIWVSLQQAACNADVAFLCGGQADIMFLLDMSNIANDKHLVQLRQFVTETARKFIIDPRNVQIGVDTFSTQLKHVFDLRKNRDQMSLESAVSSISRAEGDTNTSNALRRMREESFTSGAGHRKNATKIAILVTSSHSNNIQLTSREANETRAAGINILVVGAGSDVDDVEINAIAGEEGNSNVYKAVSVDVLSSLVNDVASRACSEVKEKTYSWTPTLSEHGNKADIIFAIDSSSSARNRNFNYILRFISSVVKDLEIGQDSIRVGVLTFSGRPDTRINLNRFYNKTSLVKAIDRIEYREGGSILSKAITHLQDVMFKDHSGDRPEVPNIAVIITDRKFSNPDGVKVAAQKARNNGITIFTVGIGAKISRTELNDVASDPDNIHVLLVSQFSELNVVKKPFTNGIYQDIPVTLPPYVPPVAPTPTPGPDPCRDEISICAQYGQSVCASHELWSKKNCAKTCNICTPGLATVELPCKDKLSHCKIFGVNACSGIHQHWARENCRESCGYCSPGTQTGGFSNKCSYKGVQYSQGDKWDDGCSYECECTDASAGRYQCYNKCPSYYNYPDECMLVQIPGQCCLEPYCDFSKTYTTKDVSEACTVNRRNYQEGEVWSVGCQLECICVDAAHHFYTCQSKCPQYGVLPSICRLRTPPGECCQRPVCEFQTQVGTFTGGGRPGGSGVNRMTNTMCVYNGQTYKQGEAWDDGCDKVCVCDDATTGYIRCEDQCPEFLNLPSGCSMVTVPGQCCKTLYCNRTSTLTTSYPPSRVPRHPMPEPYTPQPDLIPPLPPGVTYPPGQDLNFVPFPTFGNNSTENSSMANSHPDPLKYETGCSLAEEGQPTNMTCDFNVSRCSNLFVVKWKTDRRDLSSCTKSKCSSFFSAMKTMTTTEITPSGSTLTVRNVSRTSGQYNSKTKWMCSPCGGLEVTVCDKLEIYAKPENPTCTVSKDTLPGAIKAIKISCSTNRVYPAAKCSFERMKNGGAPVPIKTTPTYSHTPTGESPVYYRSECSVRVTLAELGEGTHTFQGYIYPDVTGGKTLVNATTIARDITIELRSTMGW